MRCFYKITFFGLKNIRNIFLGVPVDNGKPGALNLDHEPMAFQKRVIDLVQVNDKVLRFIGCKGF